MKQVHINITVDRSDPLDEAELAEVASRFERSVSMISAQIAAGVVSVPLRFEVGSVMSSVKEPWCRICGEKVSVIEKRLGYKISDQTLSGPVPVAEATFAENSFALPDKPSNGGVVYTMPTASDGSVDCGCLLRSQRQAMESRDVELRRRASQVPAAIESTGMPVVSKVYKPLALDQAASLATPMKPTGSQPVVSTVDSAMAKIELEKRKTESLQSEIAELEAKLKGDSNG